MFRTGSHTADHHDRCAWLCSSPGLPSHSLSAVPGKGGRIWSESTSSLSTFLPGLNSACDAVTGTARTRMVYWHVKKPTYSIRPGDYVSCVRPPLQPCERQDSPQVFCPPVSVPSRSNAAPPSVPAVIGGLLVEGAWLCAASRRLVMPPLPAPAPPARVALHATCCRFHCIAQLVAVA